MSAIFDAARLPDPNLTAEHETWRAQVRRFVDEEILPHVDDWEEAGRIPDELWPKAAAVGLLQLGYPDEYGGVLEGTDIYHQLILGEEIARAGAGGIASTLLIHGIGLPPVANFGSAAMKEQVIPPIMRGEARIALAVTEPSGGSDVARVRTTARRDGDHYVVNGSKTYISGGMGANWLTTVVRTGDEGAGGLSMLLIPADTPGVSRTPLDRKQGWCCGDTATIYFQDARVPVANLIGQEGNGFFYTMRNFNMERLSMAVTMEANARVCLEEAIGWARERQTFGRRLADHQVIRHKLAAMQQRINATGAYLQACARQVRDGTPRPLDFALLKVQASETMEFCAREAMQILGGIAYFRGNRVERIYREVRVMAIGGGSEEIMRDLAARQMGI